jgi:broad specificity phosphatase PhoE
LKLYLVRHGESAWNAEKRLQGQAEAPLSEHGEAQARALGPILKQLGDLPAISSDLRRARNTAALAGFPATPVDPRWRERSLGRWETHLESEISQDDMTAFRQGLYVPEGGESWAAFQARVAEAALALKKDTIVFTHGGCARALVAHVTGADWRTVVGPANTSLTVVRLGKSPRMLAFNWTPQAPGLQAASDPGA